MCISQAHAVIYTHISNTRTCIYNYVYNRIYTYTHNYIYYMYVCELKQIWISHVSWRVGKEKQSVFLSPRCQGALSFDPTFDEKKNNKSKTSQGFFLHLSSHLLPSQLGLDCASPSAILCISILILSLPLSRSTSYRIISDESSTSTSSTSMSSSSTSFVGLASRLPSTHVSFTRIWPVTKPCFLGRCRKHLEGCLPVLVDI